MKGKLYQEELFLSYNLLFFISCRFLLQEKRCKNLTYGVVRWEEAFFKRQEKTLLKFEGLGHQINIYFYNKNEV